MRILVRLFGITVAVIIERQSALFASTFIAVKSLGLCPRFIRTDRGTETVLLTTMHFSLFIEACLAEQWPDNEY